MVEIHLPLMPGGFSNEQALEVVPASLASSGH